MKRFYKLLQDGGGGYDQTFDGPNANHGGLPGTSGLTPAPYRSFQADEEELKSPNGKSKAEIREVIEGLKGRESLDKTDISKLCSTLDQIIKKI